MQLALQPAVPVCGMHATSAISWNDSYTGMLHAAAMLLQRCQLSQGNTKGSVLAATGCALLLLQADTTSYAEDLHVIHTKQDTPTAAVVHDECAVYLYTV